MHSTETDTNPYNSVIRILGRTLSAFDDDQLIPTYGFGDLGSKDHSLVSFDATGAGAPIKTLDSVLTAYNDLISKFQLSGPTSFAPAIFKAIEICRESKGQYHILVIVADGQVRRRTPRSHVSADADVPTDIAVPAQALPCSAMLAGIAVRRRRDQRAQVSAGACMSHTVKAIVEASNYPISIVMVGVGDGPFDQMEEFDDQLMQRLFDNFQLCASPSCFFGAQNMPA